VRIVPIVAGQVQLMELPGGQSGAASYSSTIRAFSSYKIHSMILVMFSQFLDPAKSLAVQVVQLAATFLFVCMIGVAAYVAFA
jgi:threonine/homoserine/homoserine lactone efflux protein